MAENLWLLVVLGGPVILALFFFYVLMRRRKRAEPAERPRGEEATKELYRKDATEGDRTHPPEY
ncbi:LPXTG cell wall anchor domain-containing protein [Stappia indica]|jgi:LPXTG-motif cell wall-anchored protein|uniref:LPXTG cell wall anchor domain-containing protein n=1 Tax=Stappia indica TaxID=538381 RepID=A0A857C6K1_9HYPH|nr:LPXTG cell wall anchor domain-containing protein [Stappia indica]QGZ34600.1 LPXTG cell wall anchor domain-containing protein [Stappia indica]